MEFKVLVEGIKASTTEKLMEIREDVQERVDSQAGFAMKESEFFQQAFFANDCVRLALIDKELADRK